jgi:hypothetical protein
MPEDSFLAIALFRTNFFGLRGVLFICLLDKGLLADQEKTCNCPVWNGDLFAIAACGPSRSGSALDEYCPAVSLEFSKVFG